MANPMLTTTCFLRSFTLKILGFSGLQKNLALRLNLLSLTGIHWITVILVWLLFPKGNLYSRPLKISTWAWCWLPKPPKPPWKLSHWEKNWEESLPALLNVKGLPGCGPYPLLVGQKATDIKSHITTEKNDNLLIQNMASYNNPQMNPFSHWCTTSPEFH